jgi:hypothetical protein
VEAKHPSRLELSRYFAQWKTGRWLGGGVRGSGILVIDDVFYLLKKSIGPNPTQPPSLVGRPAVEKARKLILSPTREKSRKRARMSEVSTGSQQQHAQQLAHLKQVRFWQQVRPRLQDINMTTPKAVVVVIRRACRLVCVWAANLACAKRCRK